MDECNRLAALILDMEIGESIYCWDGKDWWVIKPDNNKAYELLKMWYGVPNKVVRNDTILAFFKEHGDKYEDMG